MQTKQRVKDLDTFYVILQEIEDRIGGKKYLDKCHGRMNWPKKGVYFFFSSDEKRENSNFLRVTRVGTHAVSNGSKTTLWSRLRTHRGSMNGNHINGGNHRGSIFRLRIGQAMINKYDLQEKYPYWGKGANASREIRDAEYSLEKRVSNYLRSLPFIYIEIDDEASPKSDRAYVERNAIALLSNYNKEVFDPRDSTWLGFHSPIVEINRSGLWNSDHVTKQYDPNFLKKFKYYIEF
jgi:hypothetical protein